eukprot:COSAG06_NODE_19190_length_849_cov_7.337333_1_plen_50_part_00
MPLFDLLIIINNYNIIYVVYVLRSYSGTTNLDLVQKKKKKRKVHSLYHH